MTSAITSLDAGVIGSNAVNPRHKALADAFLKKLEDMSPDATEEVLAVRVVVRNGIARKWKWTREEEECAS